MQQISWPGWSKVVERSEHNGHKGGCVGLGKKEAAIASFGCSGDCNSALGMEEGWTSEAGVAVCSAVVCRLTRRWQSWSD